ncbi:MULTISPECIES: hypothetical protein [Rhizobium/Agrobacterium group]|uniref:hypothetical protein n=1 Tax=Rhizobium/Agrobacterium group TaxID=227290 RepID=UPI001303D593|nr:MULTISPECIES: hypothetical protein [Rhizobium/Agrobacterium group]NSZ46266.1 hypothetical protein [Agrobacterium vitis]NTA25362.1 hypothetical protein [Allorhizobium ampelinum]
MEQVWPAVGFKVLLLWMAVDLLVAANQPSSGYGDPCPLSVFDKFELHIYNHAKNADH